MDYIIYSHLFEYFVNKYHYNPSVIPVKSVDFIEKYKDVLDFNVIFYNQNLSQAFISNF